MAAIIFMNINVTKMEYSYNFDNYIYCLGVYRLCFQFQI